MDALIKSVVPGSIAEEAGIETGDVLLSVNGQEVIDILSYRFLSASDEVTLEIGKKNGDIEMIEIINDEYDDLGIVFESGLIDRPKACRNKCIFCFVDQLPKNMRKTLYFKDDDYRLSAMMGNYITLTNLSEADIERIIAMRLPRINVSVHTVDPDLRRRMLGNQNSDVLAVMKRFADSGIAMNCQIVLCRDVNDGKVLSETVRALSLLHPSVQSVSVVPVGLTGHREGLYPLTGFDKGSASAVIDRLEALQSDFLQTLGTRFVFPSDEFYVCADCTIPEYDAYEDFLQIENGVGLVASLKEEFAEALASHKVFSVPKNVTIATGVSAAPFIKSLTDSLGSDNIQIVAIKNRFFGESITVTGLITGNDLIDQLKGKRLGEAVLIAQCMLNADGLFLDNLSVPDVEQALGVEVRTVANNGYALFGALIGGKNA